MGGRRRPRSGIPRLWPDLRCAEAVGLRDAVTYIAKAHPTAPHDAVIDAALLRVRWLEAEGDLSQARQRRATERGRGRPTDAALRSLQKRAGLERGDYLAGRARLGALNPASDRIPSPAEIRAALRGDA